MKTFLEIAFGTIITAVIAVFIGGIVTIPLILWHGLVLSILWGWFLVPLGVMALTPAQAIGVTFVKSIILIGCTKSDPNEGFWSKVSKSVIGPALILLIGYVFKFWILPV